MPKEENKVGRPFDADAARAAQKKAVETRMKNKELAKELEKNPNGPTLAEINTKCDRMISLLEKLASSDSRRHPNIGEML